MNKRVTVFFFGLLILTAFHSSSIVGQRPVGNPITISAKSQPFQRPEACLPCHQRQYDELRSSVKSGYRAVSPLMNSLELAGNFLSGGLLRPVYEDSSKAINSNMVSTESYTDLNQVRAAFCIGCHNPHVVLLGDDPNTREIPEIETGLDFRPDLIRPLRDYHFVDENGQQVLPDEPGGLPAPGAQPSLGAAGISCDVCHNVIAPDLDRSFRRDGLANMSLKLLATMSKVGSFLFPVSVKGDFHTSSWDLDRIAYLRSGNFCGGCHDVRVPVNSGSLTHQEDNLNNPAITSYRLENLNTEWETGPYNSTENPFSKVVRCQDCHMSTYPYAGETTYQVGEMTITSPTPGVFPLNFAAEPGVASDYPLQKRPVATHYFTGVDIPLLSDRDMRQRLGEDYPPAAEPGVDEYGIPKSLAQRREDLLKAAVRISLDKTDRTAGAGEEFTVRLTAVALTGHRFPSGFSQERTAYVHLTVKDQNDFLLFQSGYVVDKPHPETGEQKPDGNLDDEDLEHAHVVVDPGRFSTPYQPGPANNGHTNQVFELGPDNGPEARVFAGEPLGVVLWRNELARIFMPGENNGRGIILTQPHFEETFSAAFANSVDNYRSLAPLRPTTYRYLIKLPSQDELDLLGVELQGPLQVSAQVNFLHFPPLFIRFLIRTTGAEGPGGHSFGLLHEGLMDDLLVNVENIAAAQVTVDLLP